MWRFPSSIRRWPIIHRPGLLSLLDWPIKKSRQLPKHPCNGAGKRYILYLLGAFILFSSDAKYIVRTTILEKYFILILRLKKYMYVLQS